MEAAHYHMLLRSPLDPPAEDYPVYLPQKHEGLLEGKEDPHLHNLFPLSTRQSALL